MADVAIDLDTNDSNEIYSKGIRAYVLQDYESASQAFSKATELLIAQHGGDSFHRSLAEVYLYYGKSLLQLFRKGDNPLEDAILGAEPAAEVDDDDEDDEDHGDEEEEGDDGRGQVKSNNKVEEAQQESEAGPSTTNAGGGQQDATTVDDGGGDGGEESEPSDLQVAWEVLELAKKIFSEQEGAEGQKHLADTLTTLGEISLESNMFPEGIEDLKRALKIQETITELDSRILAETCYKIGTALASNNSHTEALHYFQLCVQHLKARLTSITDADEVGEIQSLLPEIEEKITDVQSVKDEVMREIAQVIHGAGANNSQAKQTNGDTAGSSHSASSKPINMIAVKRKRDPPEDSTVAKKPTPEQ